MMANNDIGPNIWQCAEFIRELGSPIISMFDSLDQILRKNIPSKRMFLGNYKEKNTDREGWIQVSIIREYPLLKQRNSNNKVGWLRFMACIGTSQKWGVDTFFDVPFLEISYGLGYESWESDKDLGLHGGPLIYIDEGWAGYVLNNEGTVIVSEDYTVWHRDSENKDSHSWHFVLPLMSIRSVEDLENYVVTPIYKLLTGDKNTGISNKAFQFKLENDTLEVINYKRRSASNE